MGENIRINGVEFQVVGVVKPRMQEGDNDDNRTIYIPYNSMNVLEGQSLSGWDLDGFAGAGSRQAGPDGAGHAGGGAQL